MNSRTNQMADADASMHFANRAGVAPWARPSPGARPGMGVRSTSVMLALSLLFLTTGCRQAGWFRRSDTVGAPYELPACVADTGTTADRSTTVSQSTTDPPSITPISANQASPDIKPATFSNAASADESSNPSGAAGDQVTAPALGMTVQDFEQLAMTFNPTLRQLQAHVEAARGQWIQGGLRPNPVLGITGQEIGNEGAAGQQGIFVGQEIVTADKLCLNQRTAEWEIQKRAQQLEAQRLRVLTDVRSRFYSARIAEERVQVAHELLEVAEVAEGNAKKLVLVQEPLSVLRQAEIETELARLFEQNARIQSDAAWQRLVAVVGQSHLRRPRLIAELTEAVPELQFEQALENLKQRSPELAAAVSEQQRTRWALQRACAQATPNFNVQAGVYYSANTDDTVASYQLAIPLPIRNRNQGGILEAQWNHAAAQQSTQRLQLDLQQRLAAVFQQYAQARQQAERYRSVIIPKAQSNLELSRQAFTVGESPYLSVLTAQRSYAQARLSWLNAVEQLWIATAQIDGLLLDSSL